MGTLSRRAAGASRNERVLRGLGSALLTLGVGIISAGCAGSTAHVRALRAYEREHVTPELINDHLDQLHGSLALIDRVLYKTPYQPGDPWVKALPLDAIKAAQAASRIAKNPGAEVKPSLLKLYNAHVSELLDRGARLAGPTLAPTVAAVGAAVLPDTQFAPGDVPAPTPPRVDVRYPSIIDGLGQLDPGLGPLRGAVDAQRQLALALADAEAQLQAAKSSNAPLQQVEQSQANVGTIRTALQQQQSALRAQLEQRVVKDARSKQVVQDAISATSVALRLALEASAMASLVILEVSNLSRAPLSEWTRNGPSAIRLVQDTPGKVRDIARELDASASGLKQLVQALAKLDAIDPSDVPGFAYRDGMVDELVGFSWDSVHVLAEAGGEAYFYNSIAGAEKNSSDGDTYDYTGRAYKLAYHVDPIVLASAKVTAKVDVGKIPDLLGLKLGFATNRVYKSGGELQNTSLARQLGVDGTLSDALDAAVFLAGFRVRGRIARFTSGTVDLVDANSGAVLETAPFAFSQKEISVDYDVIPRNTPLVKSLAFGFGYFDYTLPKVLYELDNVTPDLDQGTYVYVRETPPQAVRTRLGTLGLTLLFEQPATPSLSMFLAINGSIGLGPHSYYFLKDTTLPDEESNRERIKHTTLGAGALGNLGFRWRFVGADSRFNAHLEASYRAQFLDSELRASSGKDKTVNSASVDVFHGPTAALGGSF